MAASSPWRVIEWTDENNRVVKQLAFHESELREVINLPHPSNAVVREPVMELTNFFKQYSWFKRKWCPFKVGDSFYEFINQGERPCSVLAIDEETGNFLYEYDMPNGKTFMRVNGRPVNPKRLPAKWRKLYLGE